MKNICLISIALLLLNAACQTYEAKQAANQATGENEMPKATISDIEAGIRSYITDKTTSGDGYFHIEDDSLELNLRLVRVHTEYLSVLGPDRFFACVDLADISGDVYDVDFFLSGKPGDMEVTETTVHKLNGKPFYTWRQREDKTWNRVPVEGASNELLGVIEGTDRFEFYYKLNIPELTDSAKMWIPLAANDPFQSVELISLITAGKKEILTDREFGNRILYLELGPEDSGMPVEVHYQVERQEKGPYAGKKPQMEAFLTASTLLPVGGRFSDIVYDILKDKQHESHLMKARALYDYIIDNVRYAKQGKYGTGDANFACDARSGNCTEFHSLFISLARTAGIPARFAIGAFIPSERNEGGVNGYHCWAEFFAEGKWWPVDISEGNKYSALATYYFGHHPANRLELSRGRDLEVNPGPVSGPIPFHAYPVMEIAGKEMLVPTKFSFKRQEK
jgi:transglutaminase-like putative cysteine protease